MSHARCVSLARNPTSAHLESFKILPKAKYASAVSCFRTCGMCYAHYLHRTSRDHRIVLRICDDCSPTTTVSFSRLGSVASTPIIPLFTRQLSPSGQARRHPAPRYQEELSSYCTVCTAAERLITSDSEPLVKMLRWPLSEAVS